MIAALLAGIAFLVCRSERRVAEDYDGCPICEEDFT